MEAKEKIEIQAENQTLASITYQNYFRLYNKLSGMTGTAKTEADEFFDIYKLEVVEIPTNMSMIRTDHEDEIYRTLKEKYEAIIELILNCQKDEDGETDSENDWGDEDENDDKYWFTKDKINKITRVHKYLDNIDAVGKVLSFSSIIEVATKLNNNKPLGTF